MTADGCRHSSIECLVFNLSGFLKWNNSIQNINNKTHWNKTQDSFNFYLLYTKHNSHFTTFVLMYFFQIPNYPKCNKSFVNFALVMMRSFAFIFHSFSFLNILLCLKWWRSQTTNHLAWLAVPSWCQTQLFLFSQDPSLPRNLKWCVQAPAKNTRAFTAAWTQWKRWSLWSVLALCPLEAENNLRLGCFHPSSPFDKASATLTCL